MKSFYREFLLLIFLIVAFIAGCKKDENPCYCQPPGYKTPYDPDFVVFPTAHAHWQLQSSYNYVQNDITYMGFHSDHVFIGPLKIINTRTIPMNATTLLDASAPSQKEYYALLRNYQGSNWYSGSNPVYYNGSDTVLFYRVDTIEKILYEVISINNEYYEDPVFDSDVNVGDYLSYCGGSGQSTYFAKTLIYSRDSILVNTNYWPRYNSLIKGDLRFFKHTTITDSGYNGSSTWEKIYYKTDSLHLFSF